MKSSLGKYSIIFLGIFLLVPVFAHAAAVCSNVSDQKTVSSSGRQWLAGGYDGIWDPRTNPYFADWYSYCQNESNSLQHSIDCSQEITGELVPSPGYPYFTASYYYNLNYGNLVSYPYTSWPGPDYTTDFEDADGMTCIYYPPAATISANPTTVNSGNSTSLTYKCTNSTSGTINGVGAIKADGNSHTIPVTPSGSTTYTLTCTDGYGQAQNSVGVTVNGAGPSCAADYGQACPSSGTNSCGTHGYGTYSCGGVCNAVAPPNPPSCSPSGTMSAQLPPSSQTIGYGQASQTATLSARCYDTVTPSEYPVNMTIDNGVYSGTNNGFFQQFTGLTPSVTTTYHMRCWSSDVSDGTTATVTVVPYPDLTAGAITDTTAVGGTAQTYTASVSNGTGDGATGSTFYTLFQSATGFDSGGNPQNVVDQSAVTSPALSGGSSENVTSASFSFPDTGSQYNVYVRACADKQNGSDQYGQIDEGPNHAGENNNCGQWTSIAVYPPVCSPLSPGVGCYCDVSPSSGQLLPSPQQFTWTAQPVGGNGSYTYQWAGDKDSFGNGPSGTGQTASVTYHSASSPTGYSANVTISSAGTSKNVVCSDNAVVTKCGSPNASMTVSPARVEAGDNNVTFSWSANGVNSSCIVTSSDNSYNPPPFNPPANQCSIAQNNHIEAINTQVTYTISCDGAVKGQPGYAQATANVVPNFNDF